MPVVTDEQVREELMALLRYANCSEIARELGLSPQAVINWQEGKNTSPHRLLQVRRLYGLSETTEKAPSAEAEGAMLDRIYALLRLTAEKAQVDPQRIAAIEEADRRVRALGRSQPPSGALRPKADSLSQDA